MKILRNLFFTFLFVMASINVFSQATYPGKSPGNAIALHSGHHLSLENNVVKIIFLVNENQIKPEKFMDKENKKEMDLLPFNWFSITLKNGKIITGKDFKLENLPEIKPASIKMNSAKCADKVKGKIISATLINKSSGLTIKWEAQLKDGSNYIKQQWSFYAKDSLEIVKYSMLEIPSSEVKQAGTVDGTPLVSNQMFFALEHPMSKNEINNKSADSYLPRQEVLKHSDSMVITTVFGVTPKDQLRRGFLYYVERERAHPYRPFLHYNSWYDLSWIDRKMTDSLCFDRIKIYGDSLIRKRNVKLKAFLFDDGWDDNASLWEVNKFFPEGFTNMKNLAESYGAELGLWLSPWGGYDSAKMERLKYGRLQNPPFETNENGFSLSGPVYFKRFEKVTTDFMRKDKVAIFKFDGVGAGNGASGAGLKYQKDIEALLLLTQKLRSINLDLYLSLTVGTWPSVYWLYYGDAIWRAGDDFGFAGTGSKRQQWITYRDGQSYKNVVKRAPLYPLNSVMLHGICITNVGYPATLEMDLKNISDGIWSFFASGTSLQELYINPHLLTPAMWDCLAKAAKWANENADVLKDVHWIGGDPQKGEVYGYAAWNPRKGVFSLRNPSGTKKTFQVNLKEVFELPSADLNLFRLQNIISSAGNASHQVVSSGNTFSITLAPYELKIWEALPEK
ncbi:MAG TPA: hypothetical protein VN722_10325 [Hanamia sp.]|nr:hypothetical protein [Hanamia sp.]